MYIMDIKGPEEDFDPSTLFTKKELCYYKMIHKYFRQCSEKMLAHMHNIIDGESEISLRILDWFVTKYSKRGIDFTRTNGDVYDIHINYKAQLKSYKKRYFDPFRRKKKFNFKYTVAGEEKSLYTTIGQLNFFRWAINNGIITFVENYLLQIVKAMNTATKEEKRKKEEAESDEDSDEGSEGEQEIEEKKKKPPKPPKKNLDKEKSKKPKINVKRKTKGINVNASTNIKDDEVELVLCFD
ncbi:MAG: hypothetical protein Hyperionvirus25_28 [Hyperionvirus sp.]|uniref:Uncharacterized protein n=1 Tax=Hyperionvirus sp. TaxID=2487770 RepID=A0A3G5ABE6_9VIRU|nr:MAG: hypothetical protein Hyperionvirus25_28 [Hyperionvirus sp.]